MVGEPLPNAMGEWLDRHLASGPAALAARVRHYAGATPAHGDVAGTLAEAGQAALATVLAHPGDRSAALDLLAADALVTLALVAAAEITPDRLGEFADSLLRMHLPSR
ncbi:MAG TPA: hypothetical protein VFM14_08185 [Gemmatimonadales bacterium]|nr:hypothetical protein [Gemmatimonadales bacterium]